MQLGDIISPC